jgi:radical SAM superfamily enzyme YgiQ (UPF0313 family)
MTKTSRKIALVSLSPDLAQGDRMSIFPSYGIRRIQAALTASPALADTEVRLIDRRSASVEELLGAVLECDPDLVGLSTYVWSMNVMIDVARHLKALRPRTTVVLGGPSARPEVFNLPPYSGASAYVDALVVSDGEETFCEVAALQDRSRDALAKIAGLALPSPFGWSKTLTRVPNPDLDSVASPFQEGLMPNDHVAYLETFRGCPLSCNFCQWGVMDSKRKFSAEYLTRELRAIKETRPRFTYLVDAGLNLNLAAFRNLVAAEKEVGYFADNPLICEVYPNLLNSEHLRFLERTSHVHAGVGVQSLDPGVLSSAERPFKPNYLRPVVEQLLQFGLVDAEIILGLPGDTPQQFRRTLESALALPCSVRVFRCLILPDALMTRAPKESAIKFDPRSLMMTSCHTWSESDLLETQEYVTSLAQSTPYGMVGDYWWHFCSSSPAYLKAYGYAPLQGLAQTSIQAEA